MDADAKLLGGRGQGAWLKVNADNGGGSKLGSKLMQTTGEGQNLAKSCGRLLRMVPKSK